MMSSSDELLLRDVVKALQPLNDEKTKKLVVYLGVDMCTIENIESRHSSENYAIHAIRAWLNEDTDASWEKIVCGLIEIKMNKLAKQVATQHCPQFVDAASALIKSATVHTTQPIPTPAQEAHAISSPVCV